MMKLLEKAVILADLWEIFDGDENWEPFFRYSDLGIPFAFGVSNGYILDLSMEGERVIEETWDFVCDIMQLDPDGEWEDTASFLKSANYVEEK